MNKHTLTKEDLELNPALPEGSKVGDVVDASEIVNRAVPTDSQVGAEAEKTVNPPGEPVTAQPMVWDNNKINVMDGSDVVRTFSGSVDGQNWKKLAEMYADANGYTLAPYRSTDPVHEKVRKQEQEVLKHSDQFEATNINGNNNETARPSTKEAKQEGTRGKRTGRPRGAGKAARVRK